MRQLQQSPRSGLVRVVDVPAPKLAAGQVLVQLAASLVSAGTERSALEFGSKNLLEKARARPDLAWQVLDKARREGVLTAVQAAQTRLDRPIALGYSCAGTVIAVGAEVTGFRVGDRVACGGGGYATHAELVAVPQNLVAKVPDSIEFEAAAFTTVGAIALHGFRLSGTTLGETVVVLGLGLVGLLAVQIAKAAGCQVIGMDPNAGRCQLATELGCDATATSGADFVGLVNASTAGRGVDAVLIAAGTSSNEPIELAGKVARDRATVVAIGAVGMDLPRRVYYEKELTVRVSRAYGPGRYDPAYEERGQDYPIGYVRWTEGRNLEAFLQLLENRRVSVQSLITHRLDIGDAARAYDLISGKTGEPSLGVVITYPPAPNRDTSITVEVNRGTRESTQAVRPEAVVSVGLLGAGNFVTATLLPAMKGIPGLRFHGVCTATGLSARYAADKYGFAVCSTDEAAIVQHPDVNTVVVATRHHLHARQVLAALEAGKHVFCEKPLALNVEDLEAIANAAIEYPSSILMIGYNRRFAPMVRRLKGLLASIHEPLIMHYRINAGFVPADHWVHDPEQGGGRIIGEVCHFVDLLSFLAGSEPVEVIASGIGNAGRYRDDNLVATITFSNGSVGTITYVANGDRGLPKERLEVFAGGSSAVLDDFTRLDLYRNGRRDSTRSRLRQDKGHRAEWEALVDAIRTGRPSPVPLADALIVSLTTFAIVESLRTGERQPIGRIGEKALEPRPEQSAPIEQDP